MPRLSAVALAAIVVLLLAGVGAINEAAFSVGEPDAFNETFTPDAGNVTQLNQSDRSGVEYGESVVVRDENGTLAAENTDYEWNATNGTVTTLSGGILEGDPNATIEYEYRALSDQQQIVDGVFAALVSAGEPLVIMTVSIVVLLALRAVVG